jgi:RNA polymerase sigma-70 factor (ECF subfamily)
MRIEDFESAALPHMNNLFRTALRVLRNHGEAEDAVQETYLQAWKSIHRFEPGTNIRAWLYKILFHVISHRRRKWLRFDCGWTAEEEQRFMETLTYEAPVPQHLQDKEVLAAFAKLPEGYRAVVLLADVEEFSYKEIAGVLRIPIGTVMSRLNRGRKLLRGQLSSTAASYGWAQAA